MQLRMWTALVVLAAPALAHEDDPKILDKEPRYEGPGWRPGLRDEPPQAFTFSNVELQSWISLPEFGAGVASGNSCWGYTSPAGREYAVMGLSNGTAFVEITDPTNPTIVAQMPGPGSLWRDMKVYQNYAYSVSEGGDGIQVFNLSEIDNGVVTFVRTVLTGGTSATHTLALDEVSGYLYRAGGGSNGFRVYSLANPSNPAYVGAYSPRYVHECLPITYTSGPYAGKQIVFACGGENGGRTGTALDIVDVTNKSNMILLSRTFYESASFAHQCWISHDRKYIYLDDELDEGGSNFFSQTRIFDVQNLDFPKYLGSFASGVNSVDHNLYVRGTLVFESNYRSGLRIFDVPDPRYPVQIAWYDTYPLSDSDQFNGLWSNYPYFPSGTVIGSDIERGLFVWRMPIVPVTIGFPSGLPDSISAAGGDLLQVEVHEYGTGQYAGATPTLHVDFGAGFQDVPMTPTGPATFEAAFPKVACNQWIDWYVSVEAADGSMITSPFGLMTDPYQAFAEPDEQLAVSYAFGASGEGFTRNAFGGDDATGGLWVWGNPNGTSAQPENDVSADNSGCWFTGQGTGSNPDAADVEGGSTTLTSPALDLTPYVNPGIGYWRWHYNIAGNVPQNDPLTVEISNNNGASWTIVEKFDQGPESAGGWYFHRLRVQDFVTPTSTVRVRFTAFDGSANPTIVEAAIDEFTIFDLPCPPSCGADPSGNGVIDLDDLLIVLGSFGATGPDVPGDIDANGIVDLDDLLQILGAFGSACP